MILDSSTERKFSRHVLVVLDGLAFRDNRTVGRFVRDDVLPAMPEELRARMSEYKVRTKLSDQSGFWIVDERKYRCYGIISNMGKAVGIIFWLRIWLKEPYFQYKYHCHYSLSLLALNTDRFAGSEILKPECTYLVPDRRPTFLASSKALNMGFLL